MITTRVLATIRRHRMLDAGDAIVVAVSGGPDSVALLHLLLDLRADLDLRLTIGHLDHGLRGEASRADRVFVEELAARRGLPCFARAASALDLARAERRSPEEAGRILRRRFLREVAEETGSRRVGFGHHRDAQAEAVLLALAPGARAAPSRASSCGRRRRARRIPRSSSMHPASPRSPPRSDAGSRASRFGARGSRAAICGAPGSTRSWRSRPGAGTARSPWERGSPPAWSTACCGSRGGRPTGRRPARCP